MQGAYKECIAELKSCEEFWKKEDAPFRLAGIYVQMVKAYNKTGNQKLKAEYKAKIEELVKNKQIRAAMYTEDIQKL